MTDPTSIQPPAQPGYAPPPATSKPTSGPVLGAVALGLAVLGFIMAVLPAVSFIAWLPIVAAIVLAIVAFVKRSRPLALPLIAIILAPVAWIVAIVVTTAGFFGGVADAIDSAPEATTENEESVGSREEPFALGTSANFEGLLATDSWDLVVDGPAEDVTAAIAEANPYNPAPTFGAYYTVPITVTYHGDDSGDPSFAFQYGLVASDGQSYDSSLWVGENPEGVNWVSLYDVGELYDGASSSVTLIFDAPAGFDGTLAVDRIFSGDGKAFFAVK